MVPLEARGQGDRRYQLDNRIVLSAMDEDIDIDIDTDLDFEKLLSERRLSEWQASADAVELPLVEWVVVTLDRAAKPLRRAYVVEAGTGSEAPPVHHQQLT